MITTKNPLNSLLKISDGDSTARWNFQDAVNTPVSSPDGIGNAAAVTFSFLTSIPGYYDPTHPITGFAQFSELQKQSVRDVLSSIASVVNLSFNEVPGVGDITFAMNAQTGSESGYAYYPGFSYIYLGETIKSVNAMDLAGDVWFNNTIAWTADDFAVGGSGYAALVHEIGHSLGLKHPFETATSGGYILDAGLDNTQYTVMSYTQHPYSLYRTVNETSPGHYSLHTEHIQPETLMPLDIQALQYLYGANTSYHSGNDTYTFDTNRPFIKTIWDVSGNDTISISNFVLGCLIDLRDGYFSSISVPSDPLPSGQIESNSGIYDGTDNLGIAYGSIIENATGGNGDDQLIGNAADNKLDGRGGADTITGGEGNDTLTGGAGNDTLNGGAGNDLAMFSGAFAGYHLSYDAGIVTVNDTGLADGTDTLTQIEILRFADRDFTLVDGLPHNAPTLTTFNSAVASGDDNSEIPVTFTDLQNQGDEADIDGTVNSFVIKALSSGSLKTGPTAGTAMAWATGANDIVDPIHQAYWTPAANASGILNAFTVVAKDNSGLESASAIQATVAVADTTAPTVTITDNVPGIANRATNSIAYTLAFSESVTGLEANDFTITNGTVSSVSGGGSAWSVNVIPSLDVSNKTIALTLNAGAVSDAAGNVNASVVNSSQIIDTKAPVAPKLITNAAFNFLVDPQLTMQTNRGTVVFELNPERAPVTVANMLAYANTGFYDNTLFHRVIPGFMVQGGGLTSGMIPKTPTYNPIVLESNNGLPNLRGTIAMARTNVADSATSQFFVNLVDNAFLNYSSAANPGYAVFGKVVSGMPVIDSIAQVPTTTVGSYQNVPTTDVTITSIQQTLAGSSFTNLGTLAVSGLEAGAQWSYSLDSGTTWTTGTGGSLNVPVGNYAASAIQVRQADTAGNLSASAGKLTSALVVDTTAPTVISLNPADGATAVKVGSNIVLSLSEPIQAGTGNFIIFNADGTVAKTIAVTDSSQVAISGSTVTINPGADMAADSGYYLNMAAGVLKDLAGNSLAEIAGTTAYNFTTSTSGNDTLIGTPGNDEFDGGAGLDTAIYSTVRSSHSITQTSTGFIVSGGADGTDNLTHIERLQFSDVNVALDINGNAGQVYRLYQAAFDRQPDSAGLGYWINQRDHGASLEQIAGGFINSTEFSNLYGANPTNEQFVTNLYNNVLHRPLDQAGFDYWVNALAGGGSTRNQVLAGFSESAENQANVIGIIGNGFAYTPIINQVTGTSGNDRLTGTSGNDNFDGDAGLDTVIYPTVRSSHAITKTSTGFTVSGGIDGTDTLTHIERLQFTDGNVALDINGNAGQVYRLYQAAFDRQPDAAGLSYWINQVDHGTTLELVANGFIKSTEFSNLFGANPTTEQFVTNLYNNVLHRLPDQAGFDYWGNALAGGGSTPDQVLVGFSESAENQANVIGIIGNGIEYTQWV